MNDLKDDAQELFDIARTAHEPSSRDHERVLRRVLSRGALAAGVTGASVASAVTKGALATGRAAYALKVLAGFALVGAAGTGAYRVSTVHRAAPAVQAPAPLAGSHATARKLVPAAELRPAPSAEPASVGNAAAPDASRPRAPSPLAAGAGERLRRPSVESPALRDESGLAPSVVVATSAAPAPAATQAFPASSPPGPAPAETSNAVTLTREARALADVQRALREGRSAEALAMLASQSQKFAAGALGQEREAARIVALCTAGRAAEGRAAAESFLATHGGSPVAARIRNSCGLQ